MGHDEDGRRPATEEPAKRDAADARGQGVRGLRHAHVDANVAGWRNRQCQPGDGDDAHPVAQRRDGQAGQQAACPGVAQQTAIGGQVRSVFMRDVEVEEGRGVAPSEARPADLSSMLTWSDFDRLTCVPLRCVRGPAE